MCYATKDTKQKLFLGNEDKLYRVRISKYVCDKSLYGIGIFFVFQV